MPRPARLALRRALLPGFRSFIRIVNTYLTGSSDIARYREIRDNHLGPHEAASTMIVVAALAQPKFKIEIEAVAAKA